jgi:hypothetical protein
MTVEQTQAAIERLTRERDRGLITAHEWHERVRIVYQAHRNSMRKDS